MSGGMVVTFTPAQWSVLEELVADGADNETIMARLGLSRDTVKCQIARALRATGYSNRTQLALAIERGSFSFRILDRRWHDSQAGAVTDRQASTRRSWARSAR